MQAASGCRFFPEQGVIGRAVSGSLPGAGCCQRTADGAGYSKHSSYSLIGEERKVTVSLYIFLATVSE